MRWLLSLYVAFFTVVVVLFWLRLPPPFAGPPTSPAVCLIGNAPSEVAADRVFAMWKGRFAGVFYLWNVSRANMSHSPALTYVFGQGRLGFADGLRVAFVHARTIRPRCEYFFTHDDDLFFKRPRGSRRELPDLLVEVLSKYRPLVASFPWEAGFRIHKNLAQINAKWGMYDVSPLIGFDNGVVVYHASIVDFFIPFAPRGEGGFVGQWTLGAHFINLFVTMAFRNHSICINTLKYQNTINIDNLPAELRNAHETDKSGLVHYKAGSRHPYEWPLNQAYKRFLSSGMKCIKDCRWGRDLLLQDVEGWQPPSFMELPNPFFIARRVASIFHLQHEALQSNNFLGSFSSADIQNVKLSVPYSFRINVFSMKRPASFLRLWQSLVSALAKLQCHCQVSVHVHQDYDPEESLPWQEQRSLLLRKLLGSISYTTHLHATHQGLRRMILSSWTPQTDDEFCLFLEDDIELADSALRYVDTLIHHFWYLPHLPPSRLVGISLYRPKYCEATEKYLSLEDLRSPLFLYQYPSSWGQVFAARLWRAFTDWEAEELGEFLIPNSYTNRWPSSNSWKKAMLRWMVHRGVMMVYPNMYGGFSFSTNHLERGTNDKLTGNSSALSTMKAKLSVPLVPQNQSWSVTELPEIRALPRFDVWGNRPQTVAPQDVSSFDKCTVLMAVCHRVESWRDRVLHFRNATFVRNFIVVWQNCHPNYSAPSLPSDLGVPFLVRVVPRNNSLNNRFLPLQDVATDCIISVDDDFDMPIRNLSFAVETWRGHFWNHLVGFRGFGRNHFWDAKYSTWRYSTSGRERFSSMVLPTCFIYHRKYLAMYAKLPSEVLHYVDKTMNCDDVLFNFLVSNATNCGPVVIDGDVWPTYVKKAERIGGLWHRPNHFSVRSECLNFFVKVFGVMPLRYTTSYFELDRPYGSSPGVPPGLRHHHSTPVVPVP